MGYLFFWNIRFFFSFISSSNKCALVMSNHLFPLLNISCLKEFYATISAVYSLLHLLRPVNWLGQEITPESFLKNGWCFLTGSTFEVVSLHLNWKVCHWTIEVCDSWEDQLLTRDSLKESSKCAPFCQRKCRVFYSKCAPFSRGSVECSMENLRSNIFLSIGQGFISHWTRFYLFNVFLFCGKN